ncbi:MAG: hypothetical protein ACRCZZ_10960 [Phocaeicola sp.]
MATRCNIGIINSDQSIQVIYCHFDGYYDHTGILLTKHYLEIEKIQALIELGDIRQLQPELKQIETYNDEARTYPSKKAYLADLGWDIEYIYLYDTAKKAWQCHKN